MIVRELFVRLGVKNDRGSFQRANQSISRLRNALLSVAAGAGLKKLVDLASEAAESANKFAAVFGDAAEQTQRSLAETAKATGQSRQELQRFAADIGALVKPALGSEQAAGKLGASVAELALDIASFNDLQPERALEKLRAGLIGSAEPLQSVGVDVRVNNRLIQEYAQSLGKTFQELTEGQKVQARYNAIVQQLRAQGALGDATKTAEEFANASRALRGRLKELGATIGSFLLGSAGKLVVFLRDAVGGVRAWIEVNREFIQQRVDRVVEFLARAAAALRSGVSFLVDLWNDFIDAIGESNAELLAMGAGFAALLVLFGPLGVALLALGTAALAVLEDWQVFREGGESLIGALIQRFNQLRDVFGNTADAWTELSADIVETIALWAGAPAGFARSLRVEFSKSIRLARAFFNGIAQLAGRTIDALGDTFSSLFGFDSGDLGARLGALDAQLGDALREFTGIQSLNPAAGIVGEVSRVTPTGPVRGGGARVDSQMNVTVTVPQGMDAEGVGRGVMREAASRGDRTNRQALSAIPGGAGSY